MCLAASALCAALLAAGRASAACVGDCDGDGAVTVDELVRGVNIARDAGLLSSCFAFDTDDDDAVTIGELTAAVTSALASPCFGCGDGVVGPGEECDGDDLADCTGSCRPDCTCKLRPTVILTEPADLTVLNSVLVTVVGEVDDAVAVQVNGIDALLSGRDPLRFSADLFLREGNNPITATATNAQGLIGFASITVTVDRQPPRMAIDSPPDGFVTTSAAVTVTGMVNDIVVGTVNGQQATVTVNGRPAQVANRSFVTAGVPLASGSNVITATGTDRAGNRASTSITVVRDPQMAQPRIEAFSGDGQSGVIATELAQPLAVVARRADGSPAAAQTVIFKVVENNGQLRSAAAEVIADADGRSLAVRTDGAGRAEVGWTLGTRSGAATNRVDVTAAGFASAMFTASAAPATAAKINVDAGGNQTGIVENSLARPLVVIVTDAGHNRLGGVPVTFIVEEGGGSIGGRPSMTATTDSDGRAFASLILGRDEGVANNVVEATFTGNPGSPARFTASAMDTGNPAQTSVSGIVLDNTDTPIAGATARIAFTGLSTQTNAQGQFRLAPVPFGPLEVVVDGSTVARPGIWPSLTYPLVTVAGRDNTIGMPVYLLALDMPNALAVDTNTGGTLTLPQVPGFSLTVAPGSATFPGGSRSGVVSVTVVHADKIPMAPGFGQQPRFIVTIQPAGVRFEPPAAISVPNVENLTPGEVADLYSFDHDLGQFVSIGTGTVSEDGATVRSDPGVGILKGGWHCGGNPMTTGSVATCRVKIVEKCTPDCVALDGANPVLALGPTHELVAMGTPEGGTYSWSVAGSVFSLVGPTTQQRVRIRGDRVGSEPVTVRYTCVGGVAASDTRQALSATLGLTTDLNGDGTVDAQDEALEGTVLPKAVHVEDPLVENPLIAVELDVPDDPALAGYRLVLAVDRPGIRLWTTPTKAVEIELGRQYAAGSLPRTIYVEGAAVGVVTLRLRLLTPGGAVCLQDDVPLSVIKIELVDDADEVQELGTFFSHPYPEVELDPVTPGDLTINGGVATVRVSGTVTDAIADIVGANRADITRVFVELGTHPSNDPTAIANGFEVSMPIQVARDSSVPVSSRRPFAFRGRFTADVAIPLWTGDRTIAVRADNLIGNAGYDSFSIRVAREDLDIVRRGRCTNATVTTLNGTPCEPSGGDACAADASAVCTGVCVRSRDTALEGSSCNPAGGDACGENPAATCQQGVCRNTVDAALEGADCNLAGGDACVANATAECLADGEVASIAVAVSPAQIAGVTNHPSTGRDLVNPIRVRITDPAVQSDDLAQLRAQFLEREFALEIDDGRLQLDRPFMALARDFPADIPNLLQVVNQVGPTTARYRGVARNFFWGYTTDDAPIVSPAAARTAAPRGVPGEEVIAANHFKYAAGTTVDHYVFNELFRDYVVLVPGNVTAAGVDVTEVDPVTDGVKRGYRVRMQLDKTGLTTGRKRLAFQLHSVAMGNAPFGVPQRLGPFEVVNLKTVIVGVDGFAYQAARDALDAPPLKGITFKRLFADALAPGRPNRALSALPSITWTNWPGIFSGQPPRQHGIMGNSFFERERQTEPFLCSGDNRFPHISEKLDSLGVVVSSRLLGLVPGGLDDLARGGEVGEPNAAGSLYQNVAEAAGRPLNVLSIHPFYHRGGSMVTFLLEDDFAPNPSYLPHDPPTAILLDSRTGTDAAQSFDRFRERFDILTMYLPGPDNVAHAVGDKDGFGKFTVGPPVGEVRQPLHAIHEHFLEHTNGELLKVRQVLDSRGFRNATLFALTADHGLHAYRNVAEYNVLLPNELGELFERGLDMEVWRDFFLEDIDDQDIVYVPNGGMAQIHVKSDSDTWRTAPSNRRIMQVARAIYIEAVGGFGRNPGTAEAIVYGPCPSPGQAATLPCYAHLYEKLAPRSGGNGALGFPPAIFARLGTGGPRNCGESDARQTFDQDFRWVRFVREDGTLVCGSIEEFVAASLRARPGECCTDESAGDCRAASLCDETADCAGLAPHQTCTSSEWAHLRERIDESHDRTRPDGSPIDASRSGDILLFMNGREGYLTINKNDELNGWHGGATVSESFIPLMFNIPGPAVVTSFEDQLLNTAVNQTANARPSKTLRNWDLSDVLERIYAALKARRP